jgi:hypothetical protein
VNDRGGNTTDTADDALVIQAAVGKEEVDLERVVLDAGEHALASVSLFVVVDEEPFTDRSIQASVPSFSSTRSISHLMAEDN